MFRPLKYETLVSWKRTITVCLFIGLYTFSFVTIGTVVSLDASDKMLDELQELYNGTLYIDTQSQCMLSLFSSIEFTTILLYGHYVPCILASVILYGSILWLARKQARFIAAELRTHRQDQQPRLSSRQLRGILLMLTSVITFALVWLPFILQIGIDTKGFKPESMIDIASSPWKMHIYILHLTMANIQTSTNPWLIALMQKEFRKSVLTLLSKNSSGSRTLRTQQTINHTNANIAVVDVD